MQEETQQFQVNELEYISASQQRLRDLRPATDEDPTLVKLRGYTEISWPERNEVPENVRQYWSYKEELHTQDGLVFRSNKVIRLTSQKEEIMLLLHAAHPGVEKMKAQARNIMYWPNVSREIEQFCKNCKVCQKYQPLNAKMPLHSHDIPKLPWEFVGMDLLFHEGHECAIIVDYYSFFFEIRELRQSTASALTL